ncbi:MAG TPA: S-layer homology domain-containing protein, partial [Vicinamibacteria bacterium]|nr:S-layer homology domain-containing protein [Vicinamibacteria bacterium]
ANGRMFAAWEGGGVYAQRLGGMRPLALSVDPGGNRVAEPGETVVVVPTWRNITGATVALSALASGLTGPAPGTYTMSDATASYGTLANAAAGDCASAGDCYALSASASPRPATHWDAQFTETLSTGHRWPWTVHLGASFTDVAPASSYYRFIETLLHHRVTTGCTATDYCPGSATTREQMAVFVLVAREQGDYLPLACATPVFADVPAASPFCRWVEELARRGVVAGCGGGNYCPQDAVTREQMAVFVLRTLDPALSPPACTTQVFSDVPASSPFCRWIEELVRRGVVTGCGGGNYCPASPVTREQMGVFISVTFGLTLYGP